MTGRNDEAGRAPDAGPEERRGFLGKVSGLAMSIGLIGGYGAFGAVAARYLYPAKADPKSWFFVAVLREFEVGSSIAYRAPSGARINITRRGVGESLADFSALSSTCPHLGCQVHWEAVNERYFCPCHNGAFDHEGKAIAGPPAEAGQRLSTFPLKIEKGVLYIEVPTAELAQVELADEVPTGPGQDPCLFQRFPTREV
ncbi:MAG: Rieske (2Fe-2S) protein [Planctomycetes bacterium]|nr:Rieske (2Fe-2S) protein [Planctomycetota bacterium]